MDAGNKFTELLKHVRNIVVHVIGLENLISHLSYWEKNYIWQFVQNIAEEEEASLVGQKCLLYNLRN